MEYLITTHELSIRKACAAIGLSRSAWYRPLVDWLERDRPIAEALSVLVDDKPGLGFWKLLSSDIQSCAIRRHPVLRTRLLAF